MDFVRRLPSDVKPAILVSHTGVRETYDSERNLYLDQLKTISKADSNALFVTENVSSTEVSIPMINSTVSSTISDSLLRF